MAARRQARKVEATRASGWAMDEGGLTITREWQAAVIKRRNHPVFAARPRKVFTDCVFAEHNTEGGVGQPALAGGGYYLPVERVG